VNRFSSRRKSLYEDFLKPRLSSATSLDRIAGYFQSSLLALAAAEFSKIPSVRIVCNADVSSEDVDAVKMASGDRQKELQAAMLRLVWNKADFPHLVDVHGEAAKERFQLLYQLLCEARDGKRVFEIRIVPDSAFGFLHGKAGVIRTADGEATSFIGSANDSERAWSKNYELVWEDDSEDAVAWVQEEFDILWEAGFPMSEYMVKQLDRLGTRKLINNLKNWQEDPEPETVLAEVPAVTELFGFWDHQKYFIDLAWKEHRKYLDDPRRGARFLLCDGVGLGKTLQLGAVAKLIGTLDDSPILILAPKPLIEQWQEELLLKLDAPSAIWVGDGWLTEREEFHPMLPENPANCPRKIGIVSTSIVTSAPRSERNRALCEAILKSRFSCVIWDEAHRIRRTIRANRIYDAPDRNTWYRFAEELAGCCQTMLLATATPMQLHPIELWDLLYILSINNPQIMGSPASEWRNVGDPLFEMLAGHAQVKDLTVKWDFWRDPVPIPLDPSSADFDWVRRQLGMGPNDDGATRADLERIDEAVRDDLDFKDLREVTPFTQRVVKRSRDRLEAEGKLVPIAMEPYGDDAPIFCSHRMTEAFGLAEDFARELNQRVRAGGFIKTLLQRRIGSSLEAGLRTTRKMRAGSELAAEENPEDDGLYPLEPNELEILETLERHLVAHLSSEQDPKFERVLEVLQSDHQGATWLERGTLIFTQFYDTAEALCEFLRPHLDIPIGLYAGGGSSKLYSEESVRPINRNILKEQVQNNRLKLLIGTDAASTGLNLQQLGCLINVDLPWNPTVLEQRKGRVQRGTISKTIPFYNMRYSEGVEQRLYQRLSSRIQGIADIFGVIPDFIVDGWVDDMLEDREWNDDALVKWIDGDAENPFTLKETTEYVSVDWDVTATVLNQTVARKQLMAKWT